MKGHLGNDNIKRNRIKKITVFLGIFLLGMTKIDFLKLVNAASAATTSPTVNGKPFSTYCMTDNLIILDPPAAVGHVYYPYAGAECNPPAALISGRGTTVITSLTLQHRFTQSGTCMAATAKPANIYTFTVYGLTICTETGGTMTLKNVPTTGGVHNNAGYVPSHELNPSPDLGPGIGPDEGRRCRDPEGQGL